MSAQELEAARFRALGLCSAIREHFKRASAPLKQRERYNRAPSRFPGLEVVHAVLNDEALNSEVLGFLIKELAKTDTGDLALAVADWALDTRPDLSSTPAVLDAAILAASCVNFQPYAALKYYGIRTSIQVPLTLHAANLAITACSHSGEVEKALEILESMLQHGVPPNDHSVVMTLQAANYKRRGRHKDALRALAVLPQGQPLSREVAAALIGVFEAAMAKAPSMEAAEAIFAELKPLRLSDSTRAYNALLRACAKVGDWQRARTHFDTMAAQQVPADTGTFNALIRACVRGGALEAALNIFEFLVSGRDVTDPVPANIDTYNMLIHACHQAGLLEKALEIATWAMSAGLPFDNTTYEELMSTVDIAQIWDQKVLRGEPFMPFADARPPQLQPSPRTPAPEAVAVAQEGQAAQAQPPRSASPTREPESGAAAAAAAAVAAAGAGVAGGVASATPSSGSPKRGKAQQQQQGLVNGMVPLAIFPQQLRPAPFDAMRVTFLDHLKNLEDEHALTVAKLGRDHPSWAASTLMRGTQGPLLEGLGLGPGGKAPPLQPSSPVVYDISAGGGIFDGRVGSFGQGAAAAAGAGVGAGRGKGGSKAAPPAASSAGAQNRKFSRVLSPVVLSRAPSFRNLSLDNFHAFSQLSRVAQVNALNSAPNVSQPGLPTQQPSLTGIGSSSMMLRSPERLPKTPKTPKTPSAEPSPQLLA